MKNFNVAIFDATITNSNDKEAKALLFVSNAFKGLKTWQHAIVAKNGSTAEVHSMSNSKIFESSEFIDIVGAVLGVKDFKEKYTDRVKSVTVNSKIDEQLSHVVKNIIPIRLGEKDYTATAQSLELYLRSKFTVLDTVNDVTGVGSERKIAYPKKKINWEKTWKSLTEEEKICVTPEGDLDIMMSNENRETRKVFEKAITTTYFNKPYTLIGLHGDPASGKTAMVCKDYCAANHIPVLYVTVDELSTVFKLLETVGPEMVDGKVELTVQQSIWLKCFINNLPLIVFIDEANTMRTNQYNILAPIISEGRVNIGVHNYKNDNTIQYVLAWNPNTSNTKSFDGKFFDRMIFINVENVDPSVKTAYKIRKTVRGMYTSDEDALVEARTAAAKAVKELPEKEEEINLILKEEESQQNGSSAARKWYVEKMINDRILHKEAVFNPGEFTVAYLDDVKTSTPQKTAAAIVAIDELIAKINSKLFDLTKGKDTKNPDKNSYFYISERNSEFFADLIFGFTSVEKAVCRFVKDLIPGGNTVKFGGSGSTLEDNTPELIAQAVADALASEINEVNNLLFVEIDNNAVDAAKKTVEGAIFDDSLWITEEEAAAAAAQPEPQKEEEELDYEALEKELDQFIDSLDEE